MVGGRTTLPGRPEDEVELLSDLFLAHELFEILGTERGFDRLILAVGGGTHQTVFGIGSGLVPLVLRRQHGGSLDQRARLRVCRAALRSTPTWGSAVASACGVTAATASSASRGA